MLEWAYNNNIVMPQTRPSKPTNRKKKQYLKRRYDHITTAVQERLFRCGSASFRPYSIMGSHAHRPAGYWASNRPPDVSSSGTSSKRSESSRNPVGRARNTIVCGRASVQRKRKRSPGRRGTRQEGGQEAKMGLSLRNLAQMFIYWGLLRR